MKQENEILFSPYKLGGMQLKNRIVMAPMTRSRAIGNVPNELMVNYYADRASAGLIITEGTSPSPKGVGYSRIPGIYNQEQIAGWKKVTEAVHEKGGKIFLQMMHTGRVSHALNLPDGHEVEGPSPIAAEGQMWTDTQGMQPLPTPKEIPTNEIPALIAAYVNSAKGAIEAGFDGVEIHAANGYLPMQFLNKGSNQRTDVYGGNHDNRNRFVLEVADAIAAAIGKDKTGIRLSPFNKFNDMTPDDNEEAQFIALAQGLQKIGIVYIHLLGFTLPPSLLAEMHRVYHGTFILNGAYTADRAATDITEGKSDLISFGSTFISNPDLPARLHSGAELAKADPAKFYTPGAEGYNDYPSL